VKEFGRQEVDAAGDRKKTNASTRTTSCTSASDNNIKNLPTSCAMLTVDLPSECISAKLCNTDASFHAANNNPWGLKWGESTTSYRTGDRRLLLRMLPLKRSEKEAKRSDTHRWPTGTFLQLSRYAKEQVVNLSQRRQQSHDPKLWKGLCHPLDMTTTILSDGRSPFSIKICTREVIEKVEAPKFKLGTPVSKCFEDGDGELRPFAGTVKHYDAKFKLYQVVYEDGDAEELTDKEVVSILVKGDNDAGQEEGKLLLGSYAIHLAVCEYIEPDDLYDQLMGKMQKLSLESSQKVARQYLENQTVSIDSDNEGGNSSSSSSLTLSLLCPISKMAIGTPVRGQNCTHVQCFDLKIWLQSNKNVSGGRWRCGVCEDFLSVRDLVRCGLFEALLHDHRDEVSGIRDKISLKPDGSWCLQEKNKLRLSSKNHGIGVNGGSGVKSEGKQATKDMNDASQKRSVSHPEVIDLL